MNINAKLMLPLFVAATTFAATVATPLPVTAPAFQIADSAGNSVTVDSTGLVQYTGNCNVSTCPNAPATGPGYVGFSTITVGPFSLLNVLGETKPFLPTPVLDLGLGSVSTAAGGILTASFTDKGFAATGPVEFSIATAGSPASYMTYIDSTNTAFGEGPGTLVATVPNLTANTVSSFTFASSAQPASITQVVVVTMAPDGSFTNDFRSTATSGTGGGGTQGGGGTPLVKGDTATIGFWNNKNGQALIDSLNGGPTSTNLANWLATSFPYLYGVSAGANNLTGKTNVDVAALFQKLFKVTGPKTNAQILAGALAAYVTDGTLAGNSAAAYGFNIYTSIATPGQKTINVGSYGTLIGLMNNTSYSILALLGQADLDKQNGTFNAGAFNVIFSNINQTGDI